MTLDEYQAITSSGPIFAQPAGPQSSTNLVSSTTDDTEPVSDNAPTIRAGTPVGSADGEIAACTVGLNGRTAAPASGSATPATGYVTAGACLAEKGGTHPKDFYVASRSAPGAVAQVVDPAFSNPAIIGANLWEPDGVGVVSTQFEAQVRPEVATWGNGTGGLNSANPVVVRDVGPANVGDPICKSGDLTGWTCGTVLSIEEGFAGDGFTRIERIISDVCSIKSEKGGPGMVGTRAVGILSGTSWGGTCNKADAITGKPYSSFLALASTSRPSITNVLNGRWEPMVKVEKPVITNAQLPSGSRVAVSSVNGKMPYGNSRNWVTVTLTDIGKTASVSVAADGTWSIPRSSFTGVQAYETHPFTAVGRWGLWNSSETATGSITFGATARVSGDDRYAGSVAISKQAFPATSSVVYVATGENFPDALSAAPAAAKQGGPVLLTTSETLPDVVRAEIGRLDPAKIVVVGGTTAISAQVYSELAGLAPSITRITGADRYVVSRKIADYAWNTSATAYLATGGNFPDAISAGPAASKKGAPVILVNGGVEAADQPTLDLLTSLGVTAPKIVGGPLAVSAGVAASIGQELGTTPVRFSGADRNIVSRLVTDDAFPVVAGGALPTVTKAYITTSANFPDGIPSSVLAKVKNAPIYMVPTDCVPAATAASLAERNVTHVTAIGGALSLTSAALSLRTCE